MPPPHATCSQTRLKAVKYEYAACQAARERERHDALARLSLVESELARLAGAVSSKWGRHGGMGAHSSPCITRVCRFGTNLGMRITWAGQPHPGHCVLMQRVQQGASLHAPSCACIHPRPLACR